MVSAPTLPPSPTMKNVFHIILHHPKKNRTHISLVVGHIIRNQCMYRRHEYFIDNSVEIECVCYFKIWLLRSNSKAV